jgi:hypothetical protein
MTGTRAESRAERRLRRSRGRESARRIMHIGREAGLFLNKSI